MRARLPPRPEPPTGQRIRSRRQPVQRLAQHVRPKPVLSSVHHLPRHRSATDARQLPRLEATKGSVKASNPINSFHEHQTGLRQWSASRQDAYERNRQGLPSPFSLGYLTALHSVCGSRRLMHVTSAACLRLVRKLKQLAQNVAPCLA